jgi:ribose/xylose/arabinose/galactoside ABC-type transport system permease subunit
MNKKGVFIMENNVGTIEQPKKMKFHVKREYNMLLVLIGMLIVCAIISPTFRSPQNLINLLGHNAIFGVLSIGMAFVILTGGVDLSVGSVCALSAVAAAHFFINAGVLAGVSAALAIGLGVGLINGLLQTKVKMNHFVATLGTMTVVRGIVYIVTSGFPITGVPKGYNIIGLGKLGPIPISGLIWLGLAVLVHFILKRTKFGQYVYAIGGNINATWLCGVNVNSVKTWVYGICGLLAGLSGIMLTAKILMASANAGNAYELTAISACIVGGISLDGGRGNVFGSVVGTLILGLILNILQLMRVSSYWQNAIQGMIIIAAVAVDSLAKMKRD